LEVGPVTAFYLYRITDPSMQQDLLEKLVLLPCNTMETILLFMLPQAQQNDSCWQFLLKDPNTHYLFWFITVDKIHTALPASVP
jgi:hypothetical protein